MRGRQIRYLLQYSLTPVNLNSLTVARVLAIFVVLNYGQHIVSSYYCRSCSVSSAASWGLPGPCLCSLVGLVVSHWSGGSWIGSVAVSVSDWSKIDGSLSSSLSMSDIVVEVIEKSIVHREVGGTGNISSSWGWGKSDWSYGDLSQPVDSQGHEHLGWVLSINNGSIESLGDSELLSVESLEDIVLQVF